MTKRISVDVKNHVAHVTLNRPEKMNAIDQAMFEAIIETGEALAKDGDVRAVVLHGEGRAFCAGLDMQNFAGMMQQADGDDAALDGPSVKSLSPRTHGIANTPQQAVWGLANTAGSSGCGGAWDSVRWRISVGARR